MENVGTSRCIRYLTAEDIIFTMVNKLKSKNNTSKRSVRIEVQKKKRAGPKKKSPSVVSVKLAKSKISVTRNPVQTKTKNGVRITHREYVGELKTPATAAEHAFDVLRFPLNPVDSDTFPWLSSIAGNYESYIIHRFKAEYVNSMSATNNGIVVMAVDYDPSDDPPNTKQQMKQYQGSVSTPVWACAQLIASRDQLHKGVKERYCEHPGSEIDDPRFTSAGVLYVGWNSDVGENVELGELYFEYDIEFRTPAVTVLASQAAIMLRQPSGTTDAVMQPAVPFFARMYDTVQSVLNGVSGFHQILTASEEVYVSLLRFYRDISSVPGVGTSDKDGLNYDSISAVEFEVPGYYQFTFTANYSSEFKQDMDETHANIHTTGLEQGGVILNANIISTTSGNQGRITLTGWCYARPSVGFNSQHHMIKLQLVPVANAPGAVWYGWYDCQMSVARLPDNVAKHLLTGGFTSNITCYDEGTLMKRSAKSRLMAADERLQLPPLGVHGRKTSQTSPSNVNGAIIPSSGGSIDDYKPIVLPYSDALSRQYTRSQLEEKNSISNYTRF